MKRNLRRIPLAHAALLLALVCPGVAGFSRNASAEESNLASPVPPTAPVQDEVVPPALDADDGGMEIPSLDEPSTPLTTEAALEAEVDASVSQEGEEENPAPLAVEPAEEEAEAKTAEAAEALARDGRRLRYPQFQYVRPAWAVHLQGALSAFGADPRISGRDGEEVRAAQLLLEWQPKVIQAFGILGLGATLSTYPVTPMGTLTSNLLGIWSSGVQARYQLRYLRNQWVVPYVGGGQEYIRYSLKAGPQASGAVIGTNAFAGLMLLLNALEPQAAAEAYASNGILRTYLTAEYRSRNGASNGAVDLDSGSYYAGLRFEF